MILTIINISESMKIPELCITLDNETENFQALIRRLHFQPVEDCPSSTRSVFIYKL